MVSIYNHVDTIGPYFFYHTLRYQFFQNVKDLYPEFDVMNNNLKLKYLMSETLVKDTSEYIHCCYCKRRDFIYT